MVIDMFLFWKIPVENFLNLLTLWLWNQIICCFLLWSDYRCRTRLYLHYAFLGAISTCIFWHEHCGSKIAACFLEGDLQSHKKIELSAPNHLWTLTHQKLRRYKKILGKQRTFRHSRLNNNGKSSEMLLLTNYHH